MGVWLDGENGGVERPGASRDVDTFGSALGATSEGGGEGGRATAEGSVDVVAIGGSAEPAGLLSVVSILSMSVLQSGMDELRKDATSAGMHGKRQCRS
jgi:hypothetical protein